MSKRYPSHQDKRARWDYALLADSASAQLYELSEAQANALLAVTSSVMRWRTRWLNATDAQLQAFADTLSYRLMTPVRLPVLQPVSGGARGGLVIIENESEEDMASPLSIEDVNGASYLRLDCGCGSARYFALSEAAVNPDGTPESPTGSGSLSSAPFPDSQPSPGCYADAAVDYLSQRFVQYVEFVTALSATALDAAFLAADEVLDVFAILSGASNNDPVLEAIREAGTAALQTSVNANRAALVSAWEANGQLNRYELLQWVNRTQFASDGLLLSNAMRYWLANSIIPGYNRDLALLAQQCATGNVEVQPPGAVPPGNTFDFAAGGNTYRTGRIGTVTNLAVGAQETVGDIPANTIRWVWRTNEFNVEYSIAGGAFSEPNMQNVTEYCTYDDGLWDTLRAGWEAATGLITQAHRNGTFGINPAAGLLVARRDAQYGSAVPEIDAWWIEQLP